MSSAFVKESDEEWLHDIAPTTTALIYYLTRQNNGVRVYEKKTYTQQGKTIVQMSNGLSYFINQNGQWEIQW